MSRADLNHMILRPGELHICIVMAQLRTLGAFIENSGIDMAWVESELYAAVSPAGVNSCKIHLEQLAKQLGKACFSGERTQVKEAHQEMVNAMKTIGILDKMKAFDEVHYNNPMFKVFHHYMQMTQLCAYDSVIPGRNESIADPEIYAEFQNGNWVVNKNPRVAFCALGADHSLEHINRSMKVTGGLVGITLNTSAHAKFFSDRPRTGQNWPDKQVKPRIWYPELCEETYFVTGSGQRHRVIKLRPIVQTIGSAKTAALPALHVLSGAVNTGSFAGYRE
ncbi:hypothetical protein QZH41_005461 [Actinostola sp. cb2023]|nr:hypothetical protein QZH41_005461 [Actinostola sp. cb2023]